MWSLVCPRWIVMIIKTKKKTGRKDILLSRCGSDILGLYYWWWSNYIYYYTYTSIWCDVWWKLAVAALLWLPTTMAHVVYINVCGRKIDHQMMDTTFSGAWQWYGYLPIRNEMLHLVASCAAMLPMIMMMAVEYVTVKNLKTIYIIVTNSIFLAIFKWQR